MSLGITVISIMGLLAAFLGLVGLPLPFNAIYKIVDTLYTAGGWWSYLKISYGFRVLLITIFFILPHFIYALSSIEVFFLKRWARKTMLYIAPLSAIFTILVSLFIIISPIYSPTGLPGASIKLAWTYLAGLYVVISTIIIIFFLKQPKVKQQFMRRNP